MGFAYSIARSEDTPGKLYLREWQILCLMHDMSLAYRWYSIRAFYSLGELEWGLAPVSYQTEKGNLVEFCSSSRGNAHIKSH